MLLGGCAEAQLIAHTAKEIKHAAEPDSSTQGNYKVGKPYEVAGVWYYPKVDYDYNQTGIASWYGPGFNGRRTANGERYDQRKLTAAHRTLPMPSMVRVTNLENGRQIKLRVNDRGPFAPGRIIDVSERAAELLDFKAAGTAKVRVEIVEGDSRRLAAAALNDEASATAPKAAPAMEVTTASLDGSGVEPATRVDGAPERSPVSASAGAAPPEPDGTVTRAAAEASDIFIQAGAFTRYDNANRLRAQLSQLAPTRIESAMVEDRQYFRVRLGPVGNVGEADSLLALLLENGYSRARVVVD
jgi:rare lipoprotein A